jgi:hypothetical protein
MSYVGLRTMSRMNRTYEVMASCHIKTLVITMLPCDVMTPLYTIWNRNIDGALGKYPKMTPYTH